MKTWKWMFTDKFMAMIKKEQSECLLIKNKPINKMLYFHTSIFSDLKGRTGAMNKSRKIYLKILWFNTM